MYLQNGETWYNKSKYGHFTGKAGTDMNSERRRKRLIRLVALVLALLMLGSVFSALLFR